MFSCMPFLSPLLVNNSQTVKRSMALVVPFSLGRIFTYTMISLLALGGAGFIKAVLDDNEIFQVLLGVFTLIMGVVMLFKVVKRSSSCSGAPLPKNFKTSPWGLFGIGALISINPCAPILTLIALSANSTSSLHAMGMGISFGLGAVLVPLVFYGFILSTLMRGLLIEFKSYAKKIEIVAALFLVLVGVLVINGHIQL
jgi:cytochrome c biogenesis protein CcdA